MKKQALSMGNPSVTGLTKYSEVEFPVKQGDRLGLGIVKYQPGALAVANKDVVKGIIYLIETGGAAYSEIAIWAFREACQREEVTCKELIDAYWKAYSDPYVGKEGIQFRHLWKHIEKARLGSGDRLYTYNEMLHVCDKEHITTDSFTLVEIDQWRRK